MFTYQQKKKKKSSTSNLEGMGNAIGSEELRSGKEEANKG